MQRRFGRRRARRAHRADADVAGIYELARPSVAGAVPPGPKNSSDSVCYSTHDYAKFVKLWLDLIATIKSMLIC